MIDKTKLEHLLINVENIIKHQKEKEILRGESFNVFSILKMESKENETHSAFLGELLNPKGTHCKGNIFLKLFLKIIENTDIDTETTTSHLEYHIGTRNDIKKVGGRIDIFLIDRENKSISIENKIYAGDQDSQIERYCNYNKEKNTVFYLTLFGNEPDVKSKGQLISNEDFYVISYKEHILQWLQLCINEAAEIPILRESIKQYLILIKKLTSTMDNKEEKELIEVMLRNYEEASFISANFTKVNQALGEEIRQKVIAKLKVKLKDKYIVEAGKTAQNVYSQIWVSSTESIDSTIFFGIESFSGKGHFDGHLFIGIFNNGSGKYKEQKSNPNYYKVWNNRFQLRDLNDCVLNLSNPETAMKLHGDKAFKEDFVEHIVAEIVEYLAKETKPLLEFLKKI